MKVRLHIVVTPEDPEICAVVKQELLDKAPMLHFSPEREQPSLDNCLEFYATGEMDADQYETLRQWLNNDWDGTEDDCSAYGFNTKMFNSHVYYLQMETAG